MSAVGRFMENNLSRIVAFLCLLIGIVVVVSVASTVLFATRLSNQQDETQRLVVAAKDQQNAIQEQRRTFVRDGCEAQNARHDRTLDEARHRFGPHLTPQQRMGYAFTVALINALAPHQDCDALVRAATTTNKG
jgi:cbb3-type cytochrome oxidase cytochrome c subunit